MGKDLITLSHFDSLAAATSAAIKKGEFSETTDNGGVKFALGDNPPISNNIIWFDTSEYASIQGATVTQIEPLQSVGSTAIIISDTKPTETNVFWLDTSE